MSELWERRRRTFESTAEQYDRYRPSYPDDLFAAMRKYADLAPDDRILEIGCATGQATQKVAAWGNALLALEPSPGMVEIAGAKLPNNVEIVNTTFEDWDLEPNAFGLVYAAQAFHWLDKETRYRRCAETLYAHGSLALIWNTQVTPPHNRPFYVRVLDVYLEHAPELAHEGEFRTEADDDNELHEMERSGYFTDTQVQRFDWNWTLDRDHYLGLMSSHSPHAALAPERRGALLEGIGAVIDAEFGGGVTEYYTAELFLGRKR